MHPILDHPLLSERLFFPRRASLPGAFIVDCGDAELACYLHAPYDDAPLLVHFHGNAEIVGDYLGPVAESFAALGVNIFLAEYRGYGASTGSPGLGRMLADVARTLSAVPAAPERLLLCGRSLGSICAIRGARLHPDIAGMVIESGIADPLGRMLVRVRPDEIGATMAELREVAAAELDHERILAGYRGRLLVLHTLNDGVIDVAEARKLYEWAAGPKRLRIFERGDHSNVFAANRDDYLAELARFIDETVRPAR